MRFFFLWITLCFSYKNPSCAYCKYLNRDTTHIHYGKCIRYPIKKEKDYHYTYNARLHNHLCGKDGKFYERLENK